MPKKKESQNFEELNWRTTRCKKCDTLRNIEDVPDCPFCEKGEGYMGTRRRNKNALR